MALRIEQNVPLAQYTTLHVGGVADFVVEVKTVEEVRAALRFASQTATPPLILGGGSNVLISDAGYRGLVIINRLTGREYQEEGETVRLRCGAGENFDAVVAETVAKGYWGLENLSAIPGTVGATPIQNVGAYGVEVSSLVTAVIAIHSKTYEEKIFTLTECAFGYRDSFFKNEAGRAWVVTAVEFTLSKKSQPHLEYGALTELQTVPSLTPAHVRAKVTEIRAGKFPDWHEVGTAGSFFKNPIIPRTQYEALVQKYPELPSFSVGASMVKVPLGYILDRVCQLRGYCEEGVCLYEQQALVLVNVGNANAATIDAFAKKVAMMVKEKTGIEIEREVRSV
jgi:UDP-N-acetylmuramate dehydrogenase